MSANITRTIAEAYGSMTEATFKPGPYRSPSPHSASNASQGAMETSYSAHTDSANSDAHWHAASDHQSAADVHNTAANLHKKLLAKAKDPAEIKHHNHMIAFHNAGAEFHSKVAGLHKQYDTTN